jgi:hypothetical protein
LGVSISAVETSRRLDEIPGVVLALATALVASVCRRGGIPIGAKLRGPDWADAEAELRGMQAKARKHQILVALAVPFDGRVRGLMNIFSLGMDTLAEKIQRHGIYAAVHNYAEWQSVHRYRGRDAAATSTAFARAAHIAGLETWCSV